MGKKRSQRHKQFITSGAGVYVSLSGDLCGSALSLLESALRDRQRNMRYHDNHYTSHAVGSIVLLATAFDAWLNESILHLSHRGQDEDTPFTREDLRRIADNDVGAKYREILRRVVNAKVPKQGDLHLLMLVRHEIVHFLPRVIKHVRPIPWEKQYSASGEEIGASRVMTLDESQQVARGYVPPQLMPLFDRQLLFAPWWESPDAGFPLAQQLSSYKLAHWAWETVAAAVTAFLNALGDEAEMIAHMAGNFERFRVLPQPDDFAAYDAAHGLE